MLFLKILAGLVGVVVIVFITYIGIHMAEHERALAAADQFCNAVEIGSAATNLAERAKASGTSMVSGSNANLQRFVFPGPQDKAFSCDVDIADGKVVSRKVTIVKD